MLHVQNSSICLGNSFSLIPVVYVVVGVGGVFSVAILIIVGVLVFLCCKYKHWKSPHPRQYSPDGVDVDLPTTPTKNGSPNVKSTCMSSS